MEQSSPTWATVEAFARADSGVSTAERTVAPDNAACWAGEWARVDVRTQVWGQAAVIRTVGALPSAHPWRLGGTAGSVRLVQWTGRPATVPDEVLCVLSVTATDPQLPVGDFVTDRLTEVGLRADVAGDVVTDVVGDALADVVRAMSAGRDQRW